MSEKVDVVSLPKYKLVAAVLFVCTTLLWGMSIIITKNIIKEIPLYLYVTLRYLIALLGFGPFFARMKYLNKKVLWMGGLTGLIYFLSMIFQTQGLETTTAGKAGFITGLGTIIVPIFAWFLFKKPIKKRIWLAVALSMLGMALLLLENASGLVIGDILVLVCAFFSAIFIVYNDKYVRLVDIYLYSIIQLITITGLCFIGLLIFQESYDLFSINISFWVILLYMGLCTTTLTVIFQNWGQNYLNPTQTAIIFTLEPVFAALFGFLIGNELLTLQGLVGCSVIFLAILITVIENKKNHKTPKIRIK